MWPFNKKLKQYKKALDVSVIQEVKLERCLRSIARMLSHSPPIDTQHLVAWVPSEVARLKRELSSTIDRANIANDRIALLEKIVENLQETAVINLLKKQHEAKLGKEQCDCLPGVVCPKCSRQKLGIDL